ncbi:unnamed protein product [Spirodela intermedia]|uniref:Uncharacterized protein n=1 Tax=Spirodela intermedia TaxID=51605 RepID=A0A7I8IBK8_SPIIN|nr:unnamed protein product [Spirodela intermedia]CAA6655157.1 unnamed protein product [Spirodela intermedia]
MRQPRNPDDSAPALPSPSGRARGGRSRPPCVPRLAPRVSEEGPREAPRALRMWWNRSGAGGLGRPRPRDARAAGGTGGDHRGGGEVRRVARGGGGRLGALLRSPPTPPPPSGRSSLDPPARARSNDRRRADPWQPRRARARWRWSGAARAGVAGGRATWLILPVVICLSQRLSHACVSMN